MKFSKLDVDVAHQFDVVLRDAEEALLAISHKENLFVHNKRLKQIGSDGELSEIKTSTCIRFLAKAANWTKGGKGNLKPDERAATCILEQPPEALRKLRYLARGPVVTKDGRILTLGYDEASGVYVTATQALDVSPLPSEKECIAARDFLLDLLVDYPFVTELDRTRMVSMLMIPIIQVLIDDSLPLYVLRAPRPGNAKTRLAHMPNQIYAGKEAAVLPLDTESATEGRRQIAGKLASGPNVVLFDDIPDGTNLKSSTLASILTSETISDRVVRTSEIAEASTKGVLFIATGNNITFPREMARRIVVINVDAGVEHPELRTGPRPGVPWAHPDRRYVLSVRHRLQTAILTLARKWINDGRPAPRTPNLTKGSFESWYNVTSGILENVGLPSILNSELEMEMDVSSPAEEASQAVVAHWAQWFQDKVVTPAEVLKMIESVDQWPFEYRGADARGLRVRTGNWLRTISRQVVGGYRIERIYDTHTKTYRYRLAGRPRG